MIPLFVLAACASAAIPSYAGNQRVNPGEGDAFESIIGEYTHSRAVDGTVVVCSLRTDKTFVYDAKRSRVRYLPASTFKILNSLILLQEGAVKNEKDVVRWDGVSRDIPAWNADQTMQSAFASSCVWFYHECSKKLSVQKYNSWLTLAGYGNMTAGSNDKPFWLYGSLRISAEEQINVMKNFYFEKYPFKKEYYCAVKAMMVADKNDAYVLRAKTGTTPAENKPVIGWYVGYVETGKDVWFFACNIDMKGPEYGGYRREMTYRALKAIGAI